MKRLTAKLMEYLLRVMLWVLPKRFKEMVCIVSLVQVIHGSKPLTDDTIKTLNRIMNFEYSSKAAQFPITVSGLLWKGATPENVCSDDVLRTYRELDTHQIDQVLQTAKQGNEKWHLYADDLELNYRVRSLLTEHRSSVFSST